MPSSEYRTDAEFAKALDEADPLRSFRDRFYIPRTAKGNDVLYFTGNSLGLEPRTARGYIEQELKDWETLGVEAHFHAKTPWFSYHDVLTEPLSRVVGAMPAETVIMNSLTANLHLLMVSFYRPTKQRYKILIEKGAFPSDRYAIVSQLKFHGLTAADLIEICPRAGESVLRTEDIIETIQRQSDTISLILLGGVNYYTGQAFDMEAITIAGHEAGAVVAFDLAHAAGNLQLHLHDWNVDFAAWCSYKYLNGGPGAVGGAFVHERHARNFDLPRFAGWWGHDQETRFQMGPEFRPMPGAEGWQLSNPPILQMAALRASLEIFDEAGMAALAEKSRNLTGYLEYLISQIEDDRISIITPTQPEARGCQLSIRVKNADKSLFGRITEAGVSADWREPDVIRIAPVPLYNSYSDVYAFAGILSSSLT